MDQSSPQISTKLELNSGLAQDSRDELSFDVDLPRYTPLFSNLNTVWAIWKRVRRSKNGNIMTFDDQTPPRFDIELRTLHTFSNCKVEIYALSVDV